MLDAIKRYINARFGSKRGLLNFLKFKFLHRFGGFREQASIDWSSVTRLIFICHGNICRSPLAAEVARQRFNIAVESYGIDCADGAKADPRAVAFATSIGIDLDNHRARHIKNYQPQPGDLVIGMEPAHLVGLAKAMSTPVAATLVGLWGAKPNPYIHDPYSTGADFFTRCEQAVVEGVEGVACRWSSRKI
ncbi:MAG: hypothetical protein QM709_06485 [Spongiibacteraceae bacterium]